MSNKLLNACEALKKAQYGQPSSLYEKTMMMDQLTHVLWDTLTGLIDPEEEKMFTQLSDGLTELADDVMLIEDDCVMELGDEDILEDLNIDIDVEKPWFEKELWEAKKAQMDYEEDEGIRDLEVMEKHDPMEGDFDPVSTVPTEEAIKQLVGDIKGFDQMGVFYEHEDLLGSIDGMQVLEQILEQLPTVLSYDINDLETTIDISFREAADFMRSSGYRAMDYTEEEAAMELKDDPLGYLSSVKLQYGVSVDPYSYAVENEENLSEVLEDPLDDIMDDEEERLFEERVDEME